MGVMLVGVKFIFLFIDTDFLSYALSVSIISYLF